MDDISNLDKQELKMHLMDEDSINTAVKEGDIDVRDIINVPSVNKQICYNMTFIEHLIQLRVNNKTKLYLLDSLLVLRDSCMDNINQLMGTKLVSRFIKQVMTEWDNYDPDPTKIFKKNDDELERIDNENSCPTLVELKEYEKNMQSSELEDIINSIESLRKEKDDLEHNALNARVELNYLNIKFHPMGLRIAKMDDAEKKRDKIVDMCKKCTDFQKRIKKCIKNYEILIEFDSFIYEDIIIDLSTRDNYKYNEYIRILITNKELEENVKLTLDDDLDKIENIQIIFSNLIYLQNFIKKERIYTLKILNMYLKDINANYLSDTCGIQKIKNDLDLSMEKPKETEHIKDVIDNDKNPNKLNYNAKMKDTMTSSILDTLKKKLGDMAKPPEDKVVEKDKDNTRKIKMEITPEIVKLPSVKPFPVKLSNSDLHLPVTPVAQVLPPKEMEYDTLKNKLNKYNTEKYMTELQNFKDRDKRSFEDREMDKHIRKLQLEADSQKPIDEIYDDFDYDINKQIRNEQRKTNKEELEELAMMRRKLNFKIEKIMNELN